MALFALEVSDHTKNQHNSIHYDVKCPHPNGSLPNIVLLREMNGTRCGAASRITFTKFLFRVLGKPPLQFLKINIINSHYLSSGGLSLLHSRLSAHLILK